MEQKYDIFISYRRDGGAQFARILQLMLIQRGYRVFLDYDELRDGIFSEKIVKAIKEAPIFMIVLSAGSLQRCLNEGDWVRNEITLAVEEQRKIIPVDPDKTFDGIPEGLPEEIRKAVGANQHSEIFFGQVLGATIDQMIENRIAPAIGKRSAEAKLDHSADDARETLRLMEAHNRRVRRIIGISAVAIVLIAAAVAFAMWRSHERAKEKQEQAAAKEHLRHVIEERYSAFGLLIADSATEAQLATINDIFGQLSEVDTGRLWMSQFEFQRGWWADLTGEECPEEERYLPKTGVSFGDIYMVIMQLNELTGIDFSLPSVSDWQLAAQGGTAAERTHFSGSDDVRQVAWYDENSGKRPHPSDGLQDKKPNRLDLYDMSGNVAELCNTPYAAEGQPGTYTACGGHYDSPSHEVTVSATIPVGLDEKNNHIGFRISLTK